MNTLHSLHPAPASRRHKRRVGRGHGSGRGTYSTRGIKGQKARSGGRKGLKMLGLRSMILSLPKNRGFNPKPSDGMEIPLGRLNTVLKDGEICTPKLLRDRRVWKREANWAKFILSGTFERKNITVKGIKCSSGAAARIRELGGKIVV